ncbi:AraC family transcriptional regulator [Pseudonocardia sp. NPDC046786]|uniref:helix-turn-helix transcriptional regulator n=1 Tax=Pseudonocardia sp. NPDC046786 TaxID=3155471 RepID=UPI0033D72373
MGEPESSRAVGLRTCVPHGTTVELDTTDVEQARAVAGRAYAPHTITVRGDPDRFRAVQASLSDGPVALDELRYGTECDVVATAPLDRVHCVVQPISGTVTVSGGRSSETLVPGRSVALDAELEFRMHWHDDAAISGIRIDRVAFDAAVADIVGDDPVPLPRFLLRCPTSERDARLWQSGVQLLERSLRSAELRDAGPLWWAELHRHLVGVLLATHPTESRYPQATPGAVPRSAASRAVDYLHEHAGEPFSARAVARASGTSVRSMQEAFRRELGTSPLQMLIRIRLAKACAELRAGDPAVVTVADVASRWGFGNLGRFSRRFREEFGELPSDVLKNCPKGQL